VKSESEPQTISLDAAAVVVEELFAHPPRCSSISDATIVAVDGRSGSGKTSLSAAIARRNPEIMVLAIENFYAGWAGLNAGPGRLTEQVLIPWASGRPARARYWDWQKQHFNAREQEIALPASGRVLIEGCGAGAREIARFTSALIWLDADTDVRYERAMARERHVFEPYWHMWSQQEARMLRREKTPERADLRLRLL